MKTMKTVNDKNEKKGGKNYGVEINLIPMLLYLVKRIWIILLVGIVAGAIAFSATKIVIHPTYKCSFTAYVNNKKASMTTDVVTQTDVNAAKQLVLTYSKIVRSNTILSAAIEEKDLNYSVKQLKGMVGTEIQDETEIIQVYAIAKSPDEAFDIATAIASVSPKYMSDIVEGSSMKIVEYPQVPDGPYAPNYVKYSLLGFVIGALLMTVFLIIRYLSNDTVGDENEVENRFNVPVLGVIPDVNSTGNGKGGYYYSYYYQDPDRDRKDIAEQAESVAQSAEPNNEGNLDATQDEGENA